MSKPDWSKAPEWAEWGAKDALWVDHWFGVEPLMLMGARWREHQKAYPRPYRTLRAAVMRVGAVRAGTVRELMPAYQGETITFFCPALEETGR